MYKRPAARGRRRWRARVRGRLARPQAAGRKGWPFRARGTQRERRLTLNSPEVYRESVCTYIYIYI